ncbi:MAG: flagellar export chaperone FlgN [Planctomycetota bacterium]
METAWESELASFLTHLSAVQAESLEILTEKRQLLVAADTEGLAGVAKREEGLIEKLRECLTRREQLLDRAAEEGLPSENIRSLTAALPDDGRRVLSDQVNEAAGRTRLLRHHSLTNWVLVQRTLIHLSQMLEIIATGGQMQPTYERKESVHASGALVDRAA